MKVREYIKTNLNGSSIESLYKKLGEVLGNDIMNQATNAGDKFHEMEDLLEKDLSEFSCEKELCETISLAISLQNKLTNHRITNKEFNGIIDGARLDNSIETLAYYFEKAEESLKLYIGYKFGYPINDIKEFKRILKNYYIKNLHSSNVLKGFSYFTVASNAVGDSNNCLIHADDYESGIRLYINYTYKEFTKETAMKTVDEVVNLISKDKWILHAKLRHNENFLLQEPCYVGNTRILDEMVRTIVEVNKLTKGVLDKCETSITAIIKEAKECEGF